ncbi:unnamed protein product [Ectocarpus sp. 13 AM-2016]
MSNDFFLESQRVHVELEPRHHSHIVRVDDAMPSPRAPLPATVTLSLSWSSARVSREVAKNSRTRACMQNAPYHACMHAVPPHRGGPHPQTQKKKLYFRSRSSKS